MNELLQKERLEKLQTAISQINKTLNTEDSYYNPIYYCQTLFNALSNLKNSLYSEPGAKRKFIKMIQTQIIGIKRDIFLESLQLEDFVNLNPPIMDQGLVPKLSYGIRPDYCCAEYQKAARNHVELQNIYREYRREPSEQNKEILLKKAAISMYIVRCNLSHEGKSLDGPDLPKNERDYIVSQTTIQLQKILLNLLLDYPDEKLVVYGTLARNGINNSIIANLKGKWEKCKIEGMISEENGLPYFRWTKNGNFIIADLFTSQDLIKNWETIDRFEGRKYQRRLIPVFLDQNLITVGYIYLKSTYGVT